MADGTSPVEGGHMENVNCPKCGRQAAADALACPDCGHALNGQAPPGTGTNPAGYPPRPPGVPDGRLPPELREWARAQPFDLEAFRAGVREIEETGGLRFEDFIEELERAAG